MIKNLVFFAALILVLIMCAACNKKNGNIFYLNNFGQDGSNSFTTGDNTYLDNSWGYSDFKFNTTHHRYYKPELYHVRDTGARDFPCCGQNVFFDLDFNRH